MKTRILATLVLCPFLLFSCHKDKKAPVDTDPEKLNPETNKVLHYSFNGSLNEISGNQLNPLDSNNIAYTADRFGRPNMAVAMGGNNMNSHMLTPSLSSVISGLPVSVSFWFKTSDVSQMQCIAKSDGFERSTYSGFTIYLSAWGEKRLSFSFADNSGRNYSLIVTPEAITAPDNWYHAVFCVRSATDYDFYLNGVKYNDCTVGGTVTTMVFNPPSVGILGMYDGVASSGLKGALDDYRVYNRSLTAAEVAALYEFHP